MQPTKPGVMTDNLLQHQSLARVLSANVSLGSGETFDSTTGYPLTFKQDNGEGILVRVGPSGPTNWAGANTITVIPHNLGHIPIGYIIARMSQFGQIADLGTYPSWTTSIIALACSQILADVTLYIF